jgi:hypothetical protein
MVLGEKPKPKNPIWVGLWRPTMQPRAVVLQARSTVPLRVLAVASRAFLACPVVGVEAPWRGWLRPVGTQTPNKLFRQMFPGPLPHLNTT